MRRTLTGSVLLIWICIAAGAAQTDTKITGDTVKRGLGCLVAQQDVRDDLERLGIATGSTVLVRSGNGTVPGTSPETPRNVNLLLYAANAKHGRMLFFRIEEGRVTAIHNSYHLIRDGKSWSASEGNGGIATYKAVGDYATELMKQPAIRIKLVPQGRGCSSEE